MEAATPLPFPPQIRTLGERLRIDGLVIDDECAVRLAREREEAGEDVARLVRDAIEIGARVLDREQTGANADFVRAEFERAARELDSAFVERAAKVAERLDGRLTDVFDDGTGKLSKVLGRHFGEESAGAVQHQIRAMVGETLAKSREELVRQFSAGDGSNPLADFKNMAQKVMTDAAARQAQQLDTMTQRLESMKLELASLRSDRQIVEEVAAEAERGTAKGRSYEEEVAAAVDALALPLGDDCEAVGDLKEATSKKGDVVVSIGACHGSSQGRIVFEAKNARLTRPRALEELDAAKRERNADYAILVVPSEEKVPAKMHPLREYNGDKLIVAYDADDGPLALQVAYALARARVLMARGGTDGVDGAAVADTVERAVAALEDVRRIRQQLTGAKTQIDKASEIVGVMSDRVRQHLEEIAALVHAGEEEAQVA